MWSACVDLFSVRKNRIYNHVFKTQYFYTCKKRMCFCSFSQGASVESLFGMLIEALQVQLNVCAWLGNYTWSQTQGLNENVNFPVFLEEMCLTEQQDCAPLTSHWALAHQTAPTVPPTEGDVDIFLYKSRLMQVFMLGVMRQQIEYLRRLCIKYTWCTCERI